MHNIRQARLGPDKLRLRAGLHLINVEDTSMAPALAKLDADKPLRTCDAQLVFLERETRRAEGRAPSCRLGALLRLLLEASAGVPLNVGPRVRDARGRPAQPAEVLQAP